MRDFSQVIEEFALRLPDLPEQIPKNLFDILGVRNKETINSRVLAYFLDVHETHGLQSLFFDSLKTIIEAKNYGDNEDEGTTFLENFNGAFNVLTEDTTAFAERETKKRIDISLIGEDRWGIIIENKLYHNLANPLKAYWEHTQKSCDSIIGIVLTLFPTNDNLEISLKDKKKVTYLNITHKEWIDEVQKQLSLGDISNLDGLLYLKEYIKTIDSHYNSKMDEPKFNALVYSITKQSEELQIIQKKVKEAAAFIDSQITEVFAMYGYEKKGSWFTNFESNNDIYFFVPSGTEILTYNKFWFTLEVRNRTNTVLRQAQNLSTIKEYFKPIVANNEKVRLGARCTKIYTHIVVASIENAINEQNSFKTVLEKILKDSFMGEHGLVNETEKFIETLSIPNK